MVHILFSGFAFQSFGMFSSFLVKGQCSNTKVSTDLIITAAKWIRVPGKNELSNLPPPLS
jgi:hypothetical protein